MEIQDFVACIYSVSVLVSSPFLEFKDFFYNKDVILKKFYYINNLYTLITRLKGRKRNE